jgi:hypothetical protein
VNLPISGEKSEDITMKLNSELFLKDPDLTPRAQGTQMMWTQDGVPSTMEIDSRSPPILRLSTTLLHRFENILIYSALCIYFRPFKEEGYRGDEDIFRAVFVRERTAEQLVRGVCEKSSIDRMRVSGLLFFNTEGIVNRTVEEVLQEMPNEQPLEIEFVPVSGGSTNMDGAAGNLTMRIHLLS